jgi:hypothetical protein
MHRIGFASKDFTPTRPAMIQGQKHRRIGDTALDPLTVTAMVIDSGDAEQTTVLVSCDIAMIDDGVIKNVREQVAARIPEVLPQTIVLAATHTHTSLVTADGSYVRPDDESVMTPPECAQLLSDAIADAIADAWTSRTERVLGRAFGHAVVGHNRHAVYRDGHAKMYGKTDRPDFHHVGGYEDHSLDMLFAWEPDGTLAGLLLAVPCPAQVTEGLSEFSADYWHEVRIELRSRYGQQLPVVGLCAAAGDQSPHFILYDRQEREMRERRGLTERQEIARRIGVAVDLALGCTTPAPEADWPLAHTTEVLSLMPRQVNKQESDWAEAEAKRARASEQEGWWPERLERVVETYNGSFTPERFSAEIHVVRLGDLVIATNPFELFLDYSMQMKARSPFAQTMVVQLAGGRGLYLPSERAVKGSGYGAMPAVSCVGPEGGDELVEATLVRMGELAGSGTAIGK